MIYVDQVLEMFRHWHKDDTAELVPAWMGSVKNDKSVKSDWAARPQTPLRFNAIKMLNSLSYNPRMREDLKAAGAVTALVPLLHLAVDDAKLNYVPLPTNEYLWSMRAVAKLVGQDEESAITAERRGVRWLLHGFRNTLDGKGYPFEDSTPATPDKYAQDISSLTVSDANKQTLHELGATQLLIRTLQGDWKGWTKTNMESEPWRIVAAQDHATTGLSQLCFCDEVKKSIASDGSLQMLLQKLVQQMPQPSGDRNTDDAVARTVKAAKFIIFNLNCSNNTPRAGSGSAGTFDLDEDTGDADDISAQHVMLSYSWGPEDAGGKFPAQEKVLKIKSALEKRGIRVWMDVANMQGSTLSGMAEAVEGAYAVCIVLSPQYKESGACRTEADYAYTLKKHTIPLMATANYKPDGWLGILVGSKLWYNFYDQTQFEKQIDMMYQKELKPILDAARSRGNVAAKNGSPQAGRMSPSPSSPVDLESKTLPVYVAAKFQSQLLRQRVAKLVKCRKLTSECLDQLYDLLSDAAAGDEGAERKLRKASALVQLHDEDGDGYSQAVARQLQSQVFKDEEPVKEPVHDLAAHTTDAGTRHLSGEPGLGAVLGPPLQIIADGIQQMGLAAKADALLNLTKNKELLTGPQRAALDAKMDAFIDSL
eukprot:SAG31_NODE_1317_length_8836_cov_3.151311_1_plen_650_part_00